MRAKTETWVFVFNSATAALRATQAVEGAGRPFPWSYHAFRAVRAGQETQSCGGLANAFRFRGDCDRVVEILKQQCPRLKYERLKVSRERTEAEIVAWLDKSQHLVGYPVKYGADSDLWLHRPGTCLEAANISCGGNVTVFHMSPDEVREVLALAEYLLEGEKKK